jgi:hypothetical protein
VLYDLAKGKFELADQVEKEALAKPNTTSQLEDRPAPPARVPGTHPGNPIADRKEQDLVDRLKVETKKTRRPKE